MTDKRKLYEEYLEKFPISFLEKMTLEQYTNFQKDSLCYWIEFKTRELGSISGSSSFKFGIYEYSKVPEGKSTVVTHDEKYAWYLKYKKDTAQEAFEVVKAAVIKIAKCAENGNFEEIEKIKDFGDLYKWKIAFLYSREGLLPFYKIEMLRTLAQHFNMPQAEKASRIEMQRFLMEQKGDKDLFEYYDELLKITANDEPRVWLFAPGEKAKMWEACLSDGVMRIGWDKMGDLTQYQSKKEVKAAMKETYPESKGSFLHDGLALWQFVHEIQAGDIIYVKKGVSKIIGKGIVEGDYEYDEDLPLYKNLRSVDWTHKGEWDYTTGQLPLKTLTEITGKTAMIEVFEKIVTGTSEAENAFGQKQYWWLNANPSVWSFSNLEVGGEDCFTLYNEDGKKRKIFQNFLDAKAGDKLIGYESNPVKKIVALGEISRKTDGEKLYFRKSEQLQTPIDYTAIKDVEALKNMECFAGTGRGTLFKVQEAEYEKLMEIIRLQNPEVQTKYTDEDFLDEVYMSAAQLHKLKALLRQKKNLILQGAPGVGKTYTAKRLAYAMMGEVDAQRVEVVQFHQNYAYEDFIMGYKPTAQGGFELREGIFCKFCKRAMDAPDKDFFFVIDEINRGNLSKIFGELLMLIESDYRDKPIQMAYSGEPFYVPSNLYIIGMMNTADRSLAMIDYALRRRFSFFEILPGFDSEGFKKYQQGLDSELFDKMVVAIQQLNDVIAKDDSLGTGFCIGHSYFCNQTVFDKEWLENVVEYDIAPMLKEYWFDDKQKYDQQMTEIRKLLN